MQEINFTSAHKFLVSALQQPWTAVYTKIIAIALLYGATVHVGNIYGLTGTPWLNTPLQGAIARYYSFDLRHSNRDRSLAGFSMVYLVVVWWYFVAANSTLYPAAIAQWQASPDRSLFSSQKTVRCLMVCWVLRFYS